MKDIKKIFLLGLMTSWFMNPGVFSNVYFKNRQPKGI